MISYLREVAHCEVSNRLKESTIKEILPAKNSDNIEIIKFVENSWQTVVRKGLFKVGEAVMFIPIDSVLPTELLEKCGITKYTSKGKICINTLRGNRSEGLILDKDIVNPYIPYILLWDDPPSEHMRGNLMRKSEISPDMCKFESIERIQNCPDLFEIGESIAYSEKIHGANLRIGKLRAPDGNFKIYLGSHIMVFSWTGNDENVFVNTIRKRHILERLPEDYLLFGELYGPGIQKNYTYGLKKPDIIFYAAMKRGSYLSPIEFVGLCIKNNLPFVPFYSITYSSIDQLNELANLPSEITDVHCREGIVLTSMKDGILRAKCIGYNYLMGKKTTERH